MNKRAIAAAIFSLIFIAAFFGTVILLKSSLPANGALAAEINTQVDDKPEAEVVKQEDKYILKGFGGNICVFYGDYQEIPAIITDISVDSLTTNDKELLFHGIEVYGREEVLKLLEDFGS